MKKLTIIIIGFLISLIFLASCAENKGNTVGVDIPLSDTSSFSVATGSPSETIGVWSMEIDSAQGTCVVSLDEPSRTNAYHLPLTQQFPSVLQVVDYGFVPYFWVDIKLTHPLPGSIYDGFDPRVIAIVPVQQPGTYFYYPNLGVYANNAIVQNPDGYTRLFDNLGGSIPGNINPFLAYFQGQEYRRWPSVGNTEDVRRWELHIAGFGGPIRFKLVVDVSTNYPYPPQERFDNAPEPVRIDALVAPGLSSIGGSADVTAAIIDWQGSSTIGGVKVEAPDLFDGTVNLAYSGPGPNPNEYLYTGTIVNSLLAPAGEYAMLVAAWDQSTNIYLYNELPVTVREPDHGNLTTSLDFTSPTSAIMLAGTAGNLIAKFGFTADIVESFNIDKVTLDFTDGWQSISKLTIEYPKRDGTTGTRWSVPSTGKVIFDNLDMYVEVDDSAMLIVKVDFYQIGSGGIFGDKITAVLDTSSVDDFHAIGIWSGESLDGEDVEDQIASSMYLYRTKIAVEADNIGLSTILVPDTEVTLYKFKVTTNTAGNASIKKLTFLVSIGDNGMPSLDADLREFTFLKGDIDITSMCQITAISIDGGNTYLSSPLMLETLDRVEGNLQTWVQVTFDDLPADGGEQVIAAGATNTYSLRAITGTGFQYGDAVLVRLLGDTTPVNGHYLSDMDFTTGEQIVVLQDDSVQYGSNVELIWSDMSSISHSSSFDDGGMIKLSSSDWTNGYLTPSIEWNARVIMCW